MVENYLRRARRTLPPELEEARARIEAIAKGHGLDFFDVIFEMCDYDEINMLAAYGGFPIRYPHWRWGMEYQQMAKGYEYGLQKIYEMVINTNPSYAYLLDNNTLMDQKLVMAHVFGHVDFFKNNIWFGPTNRKMLDEMANHAAKIRRIMDKVGVSEVESWLDICLSVDNLIDPYHHLIRRIARDPTPEEGPRSFKMPAKGYMDAYINPPDYLEAQRKKAKAEAEKSLKFPENPVRDVLGFILDHGRMERWHGEILDIVREEAYYFAPQGQTKIMNEGWACVIGSTYVMTETGMLPMSSLVAKEATMVSDGEQVRAVYDQHIIKEHEIITVKTRKGLWLSGSTNHRIRLADKSSWKRLDELQVGEKIELAGGMELWPDTEVFLSWRNLKGPEELNEKLAAFLGYLVGISGSAQHKIKAREVVDTLIGLGRSLFNVELRYQRIKQYWYLKPLSEGFIASLAESLKLDPDWQNWRLQVPELLLRSPAKVVFSFLRALFDTVGYAHSQGIHLTSGSRTLINQLQLLLLNAGMMSRVQPVPNNRFQLHLNGRAVERFEQKIAFGLKSRQEAVAQYLQRQRFKEERWEDEVESLEPGSADVYDISVEETHRYAAGGFINHNSYWHTKLMTEEILEDSEVIDYADHHSGTVAMRPGQLNPYKIGLELWRDIELRWNTGKFGKAWADCDDYTSKRDWNIPTNEGKDKIFSVRKTHNDVTFIDEFLTEEVCRRVGLFTYGFDKKSGEYIVDSREFQEIKKKLLFMISNHGQPRILVSDANHGNRGELELLHEYEEVDIQLQWATIVLGNLAKLWGRPVHLKTRMEGKDAVLHHTGEQFTYEGPKLTGKK
jgi:stage V sporulation protein R